MNLHTLFKQAGVAAVLTAAALVSVPVGATVEAAPPAPAAEAVEAAPAAKAMTGWIPAAGRSAHRIPDVPVYDQDGRRLMLYTDLIKGKVVLFNFMYADCEGICPLQTENLKRVYEQFGEHMGKEVIMLSFTLRPETDTPEKLHHYTEMHDIPEHWRFLTGDVATLQMLRRQLGFYDEAQEIDLQNATHLGMVRYGVDWLDRWAGCPAATPAHVIVNNVLGMYGPAHSLVPDTGAR